MLVPSVFKHVLAIRWPLNDGRLFPFDGAQSRPLVPPSLKETGITLVTDEIRNKFFAKAPSFESERGSLTVV